MSEGTDDVVTSSGRNPRPAWLGWVENGLIVLVGVGLIAAGAAIFTGNWQVLPVLSGSMRPALDAGGVIVVQREPLSQVRVGDIIVFHRPDDASALIAHRVISVGPGTGGIEVATKGDANSVADPWSPFLLRGPYAYKVQATVPLVGYLSVELRRYAIPLLLFAGAALLIVFIVRQLRTTAEKP